MVELRSIQMSLFLMLLLQFTGANGQKKWLLPSVSVRSGHAVTLPFATNNQKNCDSTTCFFRDSAGNQLVRLIRLGQIHENVGEKSDRLIVMENCSLVIKKVTDEDVGLYTCQQFDKSGGKPVSDSLVFLSVVSLTEQKNNDEVTLNCSVSTYEPCTRNHRVKWLFNRQVVNKENTELRTSESPCSASLRFKTSHYIYTSRFNSLKCEVTDGDKVQLFSFINGPSGEKPGGEKTTKPPTRKTTTATTIPTSPTTIITTATAPTTASTASTQPSNIVDSTQLNGACSGCSAVNYIMLVLRVVELLLITLITVLLFRASGNQKPSDDHTVLNSVRNQTVMHSGPAASQVNNDEDKNEGVVDYENFGDSSASVVLH